MSELNEEGLIILLHKAKQGDNLAFEQVYQNLFLPVYRYIFKRVQNKTTAEDLTQTVFLKVYTSKTPFENKNTSPLAYFFTVARNLLIDQSKMSYPTLPLEEDMVPDAQNSQQKFQVSEDIHTAIERLEPPAPTMLKMKFFQGYSTDEIARHFNTSTNNVRQIQCRAFKKLRDLITYEY